MPTTLTPLVDPPAGFYLGGEPDISPVRTYIDGLDSANSRRTMTQTLGRVGSLMATLVEGEPAPLPTHYAWWLLRFEHTQELRTALRECETPKCEPWSPLERAFLDAMTVLAQRSLSAAAPAQPPERVELTAQVWRTGYEIPQAASSADFTGWCFLAANTPASDESGAVAVLDPRAGCGMTAMPGLPWGRELSIRPVRGGLTVIPGWLTSSVRPLEKGQHAIVVVADSAS